MTYDYLITRGPHKGTVVEVEQSIKDPRLETLEYNGVKCKVRRLISSPGGFILKGGMWARDNYEAGIQSPDKKDPT